MKYYRFEVTNESDGKTLKMNIVDFTSYEHSSIFHSI